MNSRAALGSTLVLWLLTEMAAAQTPAILPVKKAAASAVQAGGTFAVRLYITTSLPDGATLNPFIDLSTNDSTYVNDAQAFPTGTVSGGKATISVNIPYAWVVASTADKVSVNVSLNGSASTATADYSNSTSASSTIALPANGKATLVAFSNITL